MRLELSWTHYRTLMRIDDNKKREYYLKECAQANWTSRQLERQINSFYYERTIAIQAGKIDEKTNEISEIDAHKDPSYILKDPYIL